MAQLILTYNSQAHRALHTGNAFPLSLRVGKFFLFFTMTFLIGLLSFFYLMKFTEIHTKGYELRRLEIERERLMSAREIKNTDISKLKSLQVIRENAAVSGMVEPRNPIYIKHDGTVATLPRVRSAN